jgi:ABC-type ATPase with predicted acetyltransferase domain
MCMFLCMHTHAHVHTFGEGSGPDSSWISGRLGKPQKEVSHQVEYCKWMVDIHNSEAKHGFSYLWHEGDVLLFPLCLWETEEKSECSKSRVNEKRFLWPQTQKLWSEMYNTMQFGIQVPAASTFSTGVPKYIASHRDSCNLQEKVNQGHCHNKIPHKMWKKRK